MKNLFKSRPFKLVAVIIVLIAFGAVIASLNSNHATPQSTIVGTVFAPCHFAAEKIADSIDSIFGAVSGNEQYEKEIYDLKSQVGDLQSRLVDYENLKKQNKLYKEFLSLKEEHEDYEFVEADVIGRDSADIYKSFSVSKGSVNGVDVGDAVLYGKYLVGVVDKVYPDYSVVKTILDVDFNVSAYEILTNEISYVTGNAKLAKDGKCKMANLDASTNITYESIVCTAGVGGTVPKGLIIGTVDEISEESIDISSYAVLTPGVDVSKIGSCFILTDFKK